MAIHLLLLSQVPIKHDLTVCEPTIQKEDQVKSNSQETDLIGTPLECPFDLDVLKLQDEDFYSKESMDSQHHSDLKSCQYKPFSSFEAR